MSLRNDDATSPLFETSDFKLPTCVRVTEGRVTQDILRRALEHLPRVDYADYRLVSTRQVRVAFRHESSEIAEDAAASVICRVVDGGYGVASTSATESLQVQRVGELAVHQARTAAHGVQMAPVRAETGQATAAERQEFDVDGALALLAELRGALSQKLGQLDGRVEIVITHYDIDSTLVSTEGTSVQERTPLTDLVIYLVVKGAKEGFASRVVGGRGGLEVLRSRDWDEILSDLIARARHSAAAQVFSPLLRGRRFKVILDSDAAGAFAHEVAHLLEAGRFQPHLFEGLKLAADLELEDNPLLPGAYGSFTWDDEGVRGTPKSLLQRDGHRLLHTRLTSGGHDLPGNAHGLTHMPTPSMSNVYFRAADWGLTEIFQETREGVYARGLARAEIDTSDGRIELEPELAYYVDREGKATPMRHVKIIDDVRRVLQSVDAIGKRSMLRPNLEKGFFIAEGGPHLRLNGARCA
jgi:predicted Zn-dependent protease